MRALAEVIMRGRAQACAVALFSWLLPLVSPATIGLVSLRKDSTEGLIVTLWAVLPWLALYSAGDVSPLIVLLPLALLLVVTAAAYVLRSSKSWQWTLLAAGLASIIAVISLGFIASDDIDLGIAIYPELVAQAGIVDGLGFVLDRVSVLGVFAQLIATTAVCSLLVARWWQALLFNPGGFQKEFHGFRLEQPVAIILFALVIASVGLPIGYSFWFGILSLPLLIAGVAVVHSSIKLMGIGVHWLVLMYLGLLYFGPISAVLVILGLADSILNLRSRLAAFKNRNS